MATRSCWTSIARPDWCLVRALDPRRRLDHGQSRADSWSEWRADAMPGQGIGVRFDRLPPGTGDEASRDPGRPGGRFDGLGLRGAPRDWRSSGTGRHGAFGRRLPDADVRFPLHPRPHALVSYYGYGDIAGTWYAEPDEFYSRQPPVSEAEAEGSVGTAPLSATRRRKRRGRGSTSDSAAGELASAGLGQRSRA